MWALVDTIFGVDCLTLERILIVFIKKKIGSEPIPHKCILIGKDNLDMVFMGLKPFFPDQNLMFFIRHIFFVDPLPIYSEVQDRSAHEIYVQVL